MCERDHHFLLSEWTFAQLKKFLTKLRKPVMINILTSHFVIEMRSSEEVAEALCDPDTDLDSNSGCEDHFLIKSNNKVQNVIDRLRGSVKANLPSVIVYTTNGRYVFYF